jgi:hypothetical protein
VEIGVVSGPEGHRQRKAVARKAQVVRISESVRSNVGISITMTRKDIEVMNRMMTEPSARVYVRVVQKNNRPEPYAGATSDGIPELDLESDDLLIRNTATLAASPKPE